MALAGCASWEEQPHTREAWDANASPRAAAEDLSPFERERLEHQRLVDDDRARAAAGQTRR